MKIAIALCVLCAAAGCSTLSTGQNVSLTASIASTPALIQQASAIVAAHSASWPAADKQAMARDAKTLNFGARKILALEQNPADGATQIVADLAIAKPAYLDAYALVKKHWAEFSASEQAQLQATDHHVRSMDKAVDAAMTSGGLTPADLSNILLSVAAISKLAIVIAGAAG